MRNAGVHAVLMQRNKPTAFIKSFCVTLRDQIQLFCAELFALGDQGMYQFGADALSATAAFYGNTAGMPDVVSFVHQTAGRCRHRSVI